MPIPAEDYYDDPSLYGQSQYVTFEDILDGMLMEIEGDDDHYLKHMKRSLLIRHAMNAVRAVSRKGGSKRMAFEITVPESLVFPLPQDYLDYTRVSVVTTDDVTGSFRLQPLDINYNIQVADGWLQDDQGDLLFDDQGDILTADASSAYGRPYKRYQFGSGYHPTLDTSKLSKWGEFTIDEDRGYILFSSDLSEQEIVFEYVSDGVSGTVITVHKDLRESIENYIYFKAIERKMHVPRSEKEAALRRYKTTLHEAKMRLANFDMLRIARTLRTKTMLL